MLKQISIAINMRDAIIKDIVFDVFYARLIYLFHGFPDSILSRCGRIIEIRQLLCEIRWMDFDLTDVRLTI